MKNNKLFNTEADYQALHQSFPPEKRMPIIGITGNFAEGDCRLAEGYFTSVLKAGASPLIIPPYWENDALINTLNSIDGLLLTGGGDINPLYMGEEPVKELHSINARRDRQELLLTRLAVDRQIPILGICRGIQIMNVALGGKVYQDIDTQAEGTHIKHDQDLERGCASHTVTLEENSLLSSIFDQRELAVNSFHHQAVSKVAPGFKVSAHSSDNIIEAIESTEHKSLIGVQWHPECFILNNNESMMPLFRWLTAEASSFQQSKAFHRQNVTLDSHCDTPMFFDQNIHFDTRDSRILVDLHKMSEGMLDCSVMVAYLKQLERDEQSLQEATAKANRILSEIEAMVAKSKHAVDIAYTPADVLRLKHDGKKIIMLGIENGYAVGKELANVERFRQRGVVYMTLCHNGDNDVCDSAKGNNEHNGLSEFGKQVVQEMNRTGMIVDLSHASEKSFYDALEISKMPIICSHSSCKALCNHPRNLTDEQLRALTACGGVAQITIYNGFLREDEKATIKDVVKHINHAVEVAGIDTVGIGTDFDGDGGIPGCASASELINLTRALFAEGYSSNDLQKIWGGNFLRVMSQVQRG